jgi:hypothetical protein
MHVIHIVSVNSLIMTNVLFGTHLALHSPIGTLTMAYISFETCLALAMVYIIVKMRLALRIPFGTLAMAYILIKMCLTFHVPF